MGVPRRSRDPVPDDLKGFIALIRSGRLFEVQKWIAEGRRFQMPEGDFMTWPLRAAVETGFHSLVEVLVKAGATQAEKNYGLSQAVNDRRLDLVELLVEHGADIHSISADEVTSSRHPAIVRWFVDRGLDMQAGWPIAECFRYRHREFLGVYMGLRDQVPSARMQAAMALRFHARGGNLKWVSLLLWAGADPRLRVPDLEYLDEDSDEVHLKTALSDALRYGREEMVQKFKLDPKKDDVTGLLEECGYSAKPKIVQMLIDAGADPNRDPGETGAMRALMCGFEWAIDPRFSYNDPEAKLECIEIAARAGGRWRVTDPYRMTCFRRSIAKANGYKAIGWLLRLVECGAIEQPLFADLMNTARMKLLLKTSSPGAVRLRELAGWPVEKVRKRRGL